MKEGKFVLYCVSNVYLHLFLSRKGQRFANLNMVFPPH